MLQNNSDAKNLKLIMVLIAALAITTCILSFVALNLSCRILTRWHLHGRRLINEDACGNPPELLNFYLDRQKPDIDHFLSVDFFVRGMCLVFTVFWICTIAYTLAMY